MTQQTPSTPKPSMLDGIWRKPTESAPESSRTVGHITSRIVLALALIAILAAVALYAFRFSYSDEVYPGVNVGGIDLGGLTRDEASVLLQQRADEITSSRAYFAGFDKHWAPTLAELGVRADIDASIDAAMTIGREDTSRQRLRSAVSSLSGEHYLPLQLSIDSAALEEWSSAVDAELGLIPHDAELVISEGKVSIVPEANGTIVDRAALQASILTSLQTLSAPNERLPTIDRLPAVHAVDLEPAKSTIETALSQPVTVTFGNESWDIDPADFGDFVAVAVDPAKRGVDAVSVTVDKESLARWLSDRFSSEVNNDPIDAKVAWGGSSLIAIEPSVDGVRMRPKTLAESITASFFGGHGPVEMPMSVIEPQVDENNLAALGITTKLGVGSSNFDGSDDARATNIMVGANLLNGTLVPPHGVFSFNHSIGIIGPETGFVEGQVIDGERIGRDYGGGICQVSTTVFRAAFFTGMPIVEGWPHRWRLGFYELDGGTPGLDASIMQPEGDPFGGGDFRFENPSDSWLLIESYVDYPRVFVIIYGPDLGYTVEVSDPVFGATYDPLPPSRIVDNSLPAGSIIQTEWAAPGVDITYYRSVYDREGNEVFSDTWVTNFYARGDVYKVSPDMGS